jgi:hypothetical protein
MRPIGLSELSNVPVEKPAGVLEAIEFDSVTTLSQGTVRDLQTLGAGIAHAVRAWVV